LFASKAGQTGPGKLRVHYQKDGQPEEKVLLSFNNAQDVEHFKTRLSEIAAQNKERKAAQVVAAPPAASSSEPQGPGSSSFRIANAQKAPPTKNELRKSILMRDAELARLHADLVMNGHITEAEFWEGREHLVLAEAAAESQRRGKPSLIVDPRPVRDETGNAVMKLTPAMIEELFDEFPVLRRAYDENVPKPLSDAEFWKRYLQSKLASRNRASARGAASEHTVKDDNIFDKYLEKEDDDIEPRRQLESNVPKTVDLYATAEDHPEARNSLKSLFLVHKVTLLSQTGNNQDVTMQAGKQKQALPLIRRFNEHSERVLNAALGSQEPPAKRRRIDPEAGVEDSYIDEIIIDDLRAQQTSDGIPLQVNDQLRFLDIRNTDDAMVTDQPDEVNPKELLPGIVRSLDSWAGDMAEVSMERKAVEEAVLKMTSNVKSRLDVRIRKDELPHEILEAMTSLQTATSEFLRQFWSAIEPPAPEQGILSASSPEQRQARAEKMIGYLGKTQEKINAILQKARTAGVDANRIIQAFQHTLSSVNTALQTYKTRS
ncbi:RNA polymerase II transcription factor B subunit 1, partial [Tulasnella sp. 427]